MADFWDNEIKLSEIDKADGKGGVIQIKQVEKSGKKFIDIRNYYLDKLDVLAPGKGIAIPLDIAEAVAAEFKEAMNTI